MSLPTLKPKGGRLGAVIVIALVGIATALGAWIWLSSSTPAQAAPEPLPFAPDATSNEACLTCHVAEGMNVPLLDGDFLFLTINAQKFQSSIHAQNDISCVTCHTNISGFPHPAKTATTQRDFSLENYTTCKQCHLEQYQQTLDSIHQKELAGGNYNAAVCTDCHNPHYQQRLTDPKTGLVTSESRIHIPATCARCHSAIYDAYQESVHGSALIDEGNMDVPTCIDCHGVHNIPDPRTTAFILKSPTEMCGKCHTSDALMSKYGISTNVFTTYVGDFHGTTIIFDQQTPDQGTNKPVCFDCHGVHDIKSINDPAGGVAIKINLLKKCARCHGDGIPAGFTDAWLSHYTPSTKDAPLVYFVNLFYMLLIPGVIGGMLVFVVSDFVRRMIDSSKKGHGHQ